MGFFEDDAQAVAVAIGAFPPFVLPLGFTSRRLFGLHLHPALLAREYAPVVSLTRDDATWGEPAPSLATFVAQLLFMERRARGPEEELLRWQRRFRWATGHPPWTQAGGQPEGTGGMSAEAALRSAALGGGDAAVATLAGGAVTDRAIWTDALRAHPRVFALRLLAAADGSPLHGEAIVHLDAALQLPLYVAGSQAAHLAVLSKARQAWEAGALLHPRVALALDYPDAGLRFGEMLPELAKAGAVATLLEEAVNTGFLGVEYEPVLSIAREAAVRGPETERLVPLLDLWASAYA